MRTEEEKAELLAAIEHEQWASWAKIVMREGLTPERRERWSRLVDAPYIYLTEEEKEHDRYWARRILQVLNEEE